MRILIRPRRAVLALLLFAPAIPELLTGSTPISNLVLDPVQFAVSFALDVGLYGTGALLIREVCVAYRKGWASVLLLGGAYGIAEEGFAVHTFFQPGGSPVNALAHYGHAYGVNWLWALGLTSFHATYSIALPILLVYLWFPEMRSLRWLDRGSLGLVAAIYLLEVVVFAHLVGHGPSPSILAVFLGIVAILIGLAAWAPADLLRVRSGPSRLGRGATIVAGSLGFDAWVVVLFLAGAGRLPAVAAAGVLVGLNLVALALLLRGVGTDDLVRSEYWFATGMLGILFVWDVPVDFSIYGIAGVAAVFAFLQYRLGQAIARRSASGRSAAGPARGAAPPPVA